MTYVGMLAGHVICVSIVLVAVFFKRRWLKPVAVVAGAVALWLPLMAHLNSLGAASPFKPKNEFRVISSKVDEENHRLYLFVDLFAPAVHVAPRVGEESSSSRIAQHQSSTKPHRRRWQFRLE